ncbi:MAG: ribosome assembly cofactor RimP, partial [Paraprevotella sp.]|nr:ribosome assembly cofactor RimP [Paraprevotella sp.]
VDVLTNDGRKLHGVLSAADADHFEVTVKVKRKLEGEKRPKWVDETVTLRYEYVKYTKYSISFK